MNNNPFSYFLMISLTATAMLFVFLFTIYVGLIS